MSLVYTADSPIHGTGVFSSAPFSPGEIILRIDPIDPLAAHRAEQDDPDGQIVAELLEPMLDP
jgi:hypothetical protein